MAKSMADQLAHWARGGAPEPAPTPTADRTIPHPDRSYPRDRMRTEGRYEVPRTLIEAEVRLRECEESIADIDRQIDRRSVSESSDPNFQAWQQRAETAKRGYEYEVARMTTCVRVFRQESATDRVAVALVEKERDDARESCRRLASEVERLTSLMDAMRATSQPNAVNAAFVDVAQVVLSEVTFTRIMARAKDKASPADSRHGR